MAETECEVLALMRAGAVAIATILRACDRLAHADIEGQIKWMGEMAKGKLEPGPELEEVLEVLQSTRERLEKRREEEEEEEKEEAESRRSRDAESERREEVEEVEVEEEEEPERGEEAAEESGEEEEEEEEAAAKRRRTEEPEGVPWGKLQLLVREVASPMEVLGQAILDLLQHQQQQQQQQQPQVYQVLFSLLTGSPS